jgi:hypothetical protein
MGFTEYEYRIFYTTVENTTLNRTTPWRLSNPLGLDYSQQLKVIQDDGKIKEDIPERLRQIEKDIETRTRTRPYSICYELPSVCRRKVKE